MGNLVNRIKKLDPDDVFAYKTIKMVIVRDRRLGLLNYLFMLCIVGYIVGFTIIYEKRYLLTEVPVGSIRLSLLQPSNWSDLSDLPYCNQTQESYSGFTNQECVFWDANFVVWPGLEQSALLATSRVTWNNQTLSCSLTQPNCSYENVGSNTTYYIADLERFTLMLDHSMLAPQVGLLVNSLKLPGTLLDHHGNKINVHGDGQQVGKKNKYDIITLGLLLKAAGVHSLDDTSPARPYESIRSAGLVLLVSITYDNTYTYNLNNIMYTIQVMAITQAEFKGTQVMSDSFTSNRVLVDRHGIRMIFLQGGTIGRFDFQTMLISLVSGIGLVALSTLIVDSLMVYVLPQKVLYRKYKMQKTVDFSDIRDGHIVVNENEDAEDIVVADRRNTVNGNMQSPGSRRDSNPAAPSESTPLL